MDALTLTAIATAIMLSAAPGNWYVAWRFYRAWRGGESIRYFAPTMALIAAVAISSTITLIVGLLVLLGRIDGGVTILPPGLGLLLIAAGLIVTSVPMPFFLRLLREPRHLHDRRIGDV